MQLSQIPVQTPTPFYYYNLELLKKTVQAAKSESAPYGYRVHYAVKANANPVLLRLISQQGLGADCVSGNEIRQALEEHFKKTDHCTGIFTYNDRRAIQALGILEEMGIRIPEQAGVIGFDNTYICEYLYPRLSSIAQPIEEMAALTVQRLIHRLDHPDDKSVIDHPLHAELISRESSLRKRGEK